MSAVFAVSIDVYADAAVLTSSSLSWMLILTGRAWVRHSLQGHTMSAQLKALVSDQQNLYNNYTGKPMSTHINVKYDLPSNTDLSSPGY